MRLMLLLAIALASATPAAAADNITDATLDQIVLELSVVRKAAREFAKAFPDDQATLQEISKVTASAATKLQESESDVSKVRRELKTAIANVLVQNLDAEELRSWTDKLKPVFDEIDGKIDDLGDDQDVIREKLGDFYGQVTFVLDEVASRTTGDAPAFTAKDKNALDSWDKLWTDFTTKIEADASSGPEAFKSKALAYVNVLKRIMETNYDDDDLARIKENTFEATDQFIKGNVDGTKPKKNMIDLYNAFARWVENDSGDGDTVRGWQRNLLKLSAELHKYAENGYPSWYPEAVKRFGEVRPSSPSNTRQSGGRQSLPPNRRQGQNHGCWRYSYPN